jgi:hypothetical protein
MVCRCDKCLKEETEYKRLKIFSKLNYKDLHIINQYFKTQKTNKLITGICVGELYGISIALLLVFL